MNAAAGNRSGPDVRVFPSQEQLDSALAGAVSALAARAIGERGRFVWVLSGGNTPRPLYRLLASPAWRARVDWPRVEFFWSDERAVPPDHPESNYRMVRETLLEPLRIAPERIHRMQGERADLDAAAVDYEREIAVCLSGGPGESDDLFDLILLGLGADAHTASLFPHARALDARDRAVVASEAPQLRSKRLTMTHPRLNRARNTFFLVCGASKASAVAAVMEGPRDPQRFPAQLIHSDAGGIVWFMDAAAAAGLKSRH